MATKTEKNVQLKINKLTKNIFDQLSVQGLISEDELYLLPEDEEMVVPSTTHPGYAVNAEYSLYASDSEWADNAGHSNNADLANSANNADTANTALTANYALTANTALTSNYALTADTALTANYAPDYTPLSTFN